MQQLLKEMDKMICKKINTLAYDYSQAIDSFNPRLEIEKPYYKELDRQIKFLREISDELQKELDNDICNVCHRKDCDCIKLNINNCSKQNFKDTTLNICRRCLKKSNSIEINLND